MSNYRRFYSDGGTYFFTVNLRDRSSDLLVRKIDLLRAAYDYVQKRHPFKTHAITVLPDHLHCVWQLPQDDDDFSKRWYLLKSHFSRHLPKGEATTETRKKRGERGIWQRRFWEHLIRDDADYENHIGYTYNNPVKHGLVERSEDWAYSSLHRDLAQFAALIAPYTGNASFGERV